MSGILKVIGMKRKDTHEVLMEEHALKSFDDVDDIRIKRPVPLSSLCNRRKSQSVYFPDLPNPLMRNPSMKSANPLARVSCTDGPQSTFESLPRKYGRSDRWIRRLNTQLLEALRNRNVREVQRLLKAGASPNATCHVDLVTACHIAALTGDSALPLLLQHGAIKNRADRLGRTPLHIAAWAGHVRHLGLFLEFPEAIQKLIDHGKVSPEVEEEVRKIRPLLKDVVNTRCELGEMSIIVPQEWRDGVDHNCSKMAEQLPYFQPGWTPLHAASYSAQHQCVRLLLAAGADPCLRDVISRSPLDVAGSTCHALSGSKRKFVPTIHQSGFTEVVAMLLAVDCHKRTIRKRGWSFNTPLHTAVELHSLETIQLLLKAGAFPGNLNRDGATPLHECVKKKLKPHLQAFIDWDFQNSQTPSTLMVDVRDKAGYTVLHSSVLTNWLPGVCLSLEAGANTISRSHNGETPLHSAADLGHLEILKEILIYAKEAEAIDEPNEKGETALFKAVDKGNIDCVKMLLKEGASLETTLPNKANVFHVAAAQGFYDMLKYLLDYNYTLTETMINNVTADNIGFGPIHFAVDRDHLECVELLLSKKACIDLKAVSEVYDGYTPLHIAARKNDIEIATLILKRNKSVIVIPDSKGWNALHVACFYASRDVIKLLLKEGSDISAYTGCESKYKQTAIQMIMNNLSKPTEFIHELFDSCINCKNSPKDPNCEVIVDYGILVPNKNINSSDVDNKEMKVIEALLKTGNSYDQKRLLIHPLVESFLCLKWKALLPFFFTMVGLYGLFVMTLSFFIFSVYYYRDIHSNGTKSTEQLDGYPFMDIEDKPNWLRYTCWAYFLYFIISIVTSLEVLYMYISRRYFQLETWIKFTSIILAILLPLFIFNTNEDWPRHLATVALLLSWLEMMFLLSRFPRWGFYVLMFGKVSKKVLKILLTFVFLLIGFALSFMIEYRSKTPFENPWAAFVKTMVMMTSEFDYDDLVDKKHIYSSLIVIRLLFLTFLILAAIVLMNLMVAVAVNDLNDLEVQGNIMRLEKQVEFLASMETLANCKLLMKILPEKFKKNFDFARNLAKIYLTPCEPPWSQLNAIPSEVRDSIIDKAQFRKEKANERIQKKIVSIIESMKKYKKSEDVSDNKPSRKNTSKQETVLLKNQMDAMNIKLDAVMHLLSTKLN